MTALISSQNSSLRTIPSPKSKLLLVADSPERLKQMKMGLSTAEFEITGACSVDELRIACRGHHDLALFDVEAIQIKPMLSALRDSAGHKTVMTLVEISRLSEDHSLAGLLPAYRAMPCHQNQVNMLMRQLSNDANRKSYSRPVLL